MLISRLFSPSNCCCCGEFSLHPVCKSCLDNIRIIYDPLCIVCQQLSYEGQTHYKCYSKTKPNNLIVPYEFNGLAEYLIKKSKYYQNNFSLTKQLVKYSINFAEQFNYHKLKDFTFIPIPGSPDRVKKRGFNLPDLIAKELSQNLEGDYKNTLIKQKNVPPLYNQTKKQRALSCKNSFKYTGKTVPKNVVLVDDIITSGSTLLEACKECKKAGVKNVTCFALAYRPLTR